MVWIEDSRSVQCLRAGRKQEQTKEERGLETEGRESRTLSTGNEDVRKEGNGRKSRNGFPRVEPPVRAKSIA